MLRSLLGGGTVPFSSLVHVLDNPNAYNTSAGDKFGSGVAISSTHCIVGANDEDDAGGTSSGKAYIFDVITGGLLHTLHNPNPYGTSGADVFGYTVAISDTHCAVGAPWEDDASGTFSGKVYIFTLSTGALLHTLDDPNPYSTSTDDRFGSSMAMSDAYCIVGAYGEDLGASGKAYIFNTSTGSLVHTLDNPNGYGTAYGDQFGYNVAISDSYCAVGANWEDDAGGTSSGKVYIFTLSTGSLLHTLDNPNPYGTSGYDDFSRPAISDTYCVVGAYTEGSVDSGKAYIFSTTTGSLLHTLDNPSTDPANSRFGYSVGISGNYCIVGAYNQRSSDGSASAGAAFIFELDTGNLLLTLDNPNAYGASASDYFGARVAISGDYCVASAYQEDDAGGNTSGKSYIFK